MALPRNETREMTLVRLLDKARSEGVRLYRDSTDGRYYASSASTPGKLYMLTGYSCECAGFCQHGRCKHYAALMSALGWIGETPDPGPAMIVTVAHVAGHYSEGGWLVGNGRPEWREPVSTIAVNGADMVRVSGDRYSVRALWLEHGRVIDDMTGATPEGLGHYDAVRYWIDAMGGDMPAHVILQDAGLFEEREFDDDPPAA